MASLANPLSGIERIEVIPSRGEDTDYPEIVWYKVRTLAGLELEVVYSPYVSYSGPWVDPTTGEEFATLGEVLEGYPRPE